MDLNDKTHHIVFNAAAYDKEDNPEIKDFLSFVRSKKADSDFTRRIANMVQAKKFEQTFFNEYMAWNLHDMDVKKQGIQQGIQQGIKQSALASARNALALGLSSEQAAQISGLPLEEVLELQKQD